MDNVSTKRTMVAVQSDAWIAGMSPAAREMFTPQADGTIRVDVLRAVRGAVAEHPGSHPARCRPADFTDTRSARCLRLG